MDEGRRLQRAMLMKWCKSSKSDGVYCSVEFDGAMIGVVPVAGDTVQKNVPLFCFLNILCV